MGFFQRIFHGGKKRINNAWNNIKTGVQKGYKVVHGITNAAAKAAHWVDHHLSNLHTGIPIVDDAINIIKDNPAYNTVLSTIDTVNTKVEDVGRLGAHLGDLVDKGLQHLNNVDSKIPPHRDQQVAKAIETFGGAKRAIEDLKKEARPVIAEARDIGQFGDTNVFDDVLSRIRSL